MYDYLVVGSGLYGAVFAHEMKKAGRSARKMSFLADDLQTTGIMMDDIIISALNKIKEILW